MTVARKAIALAAFLGLGFVSFVAGDATDRYKTHSPFSESNSEQSDPIANEAPVNPLVEEEPQNQSITRTDRFNWADPSTWQAPAGPGPGEAGNAPGSTNTSPEDRDRDFETYGRGLPIEGASRS
jgi:hypothetical protein